VHDRPAAGPASVTRRQRLIAIRQAAATRTIELANAGKDSSEWSLGTPM
jgi:hypothetical protein